METRIRTRHPSSHRRQRKPNRTLSVQTLERRQLLAAHLPSDGMHDDSVAAHVSSAHGATDHHDNPALQHEHAALHDLLDINDATHVAVQNGNWGNSSTWGGAVPGYGARVHVPEGVAVTFNTSTNRRLDWVRVDGMLRFATGANTKMIVDTLVTTSGSHLQIGTASNPIAGNRTARIIIAPHNTGANGAYDIDRSADPEQLSRGVVTHGKVEIHGQTKTPFVQLAQNALRGSDQLKLRTPVQNWKVGDQLVLTGTQLDTDLSNGFSTQDEEVTIESISGDRKTITLSRPLNHDHTGRGNDVLGRAMQAYVGNYTRNIRIETENPANLASNQRGHVMFMHNPDVDVRYAEFHELGRTDKSKPLDDFQLESTDPANHPANFQDRKSQFKRKLNSSGNAIPGPRNNIRGRYAFHFHRNGTEPGEKAIAIGNSVWGSPGWGFVQHDAGADMIDNVSYNVRGAHFVAETGNETGEWTNNLAIKALGDQDAPRQIKVSEANHDTGWSGNGFFFQGRLLRNEGNVAAGNYHVAYQYFTRGVDSIDVRPDQLSDPLIAQLETSISNAHPEINQFENNVAIASTIGFDVIKSDPSQGHDLRSVIKGFTAWEVETAIDTQYTAKYTFRDTTGVAASNAPNSARYGQEAWVYGNGMHDQVFVNARFDGFHNLMRWDKGDPNGPLADYDVFLVNVRLNNPNFDTSDLRDHIYLNRDGTNVNVPDSTKESSIRIGSYGDLVNPGPLSLQIDTNRSQLDGDAGDVYVIGTKRDSLGETEYPGGYGNLPNPAPYTLTRWRARRLDEWAETQGYWTRRGDGQTLVLIEEYIEDRVTGTQKKIRIPVTLSDIPATAPYNGQYDPDSQSGNPGGSGRTTTLEPFADDSRQSGNGTETVSSASRWNWFGMKFDLQNIDEVAEATLRVHRRDEATAAVFSAFAGSSDQWAEGDATIPGSQGDALDSVASGPGDDWLEFDVTSFVQNEAQGDEVATLLIKTDLNTWSTKLHTREHAEFKPELVIRSQESSAPVTTTLGATADVTRTNNIDGNRTTSAASKFNEFYLKFNVSSIDSLRNAKLRLFRRNSDTASSTVSVFGSVSDNWNESTAKNDFPGVQGNAVDSVTSGGGGEWLEFDVTSLVQSELDGNGIVTLVIKSDLTNWGTQFHTSENSLNAPELVIQS